MDYVHERTALADTGRILLDRGLVARTWGNLSVRVADGFFLITPSGRNYEDLLPEDMALVNLSDLSWSGSLKPSSEKELHARIYRSRAGVGAVIHTHQPAASSLAAARRGFTPEEGEPIPCVPYALPTTSRLARLVEKAVEDSPSNAVLLSNHGAVCMDTNIGAALSASIALEETAEAQVLSISGGTREEMLDAFIESRQSGSGPVPAVLSPGQVSQLVADLEPSLGGRHLVVASGPYSLAASRALKTLRPMLDDLAQLAGPKIRAIDPGAALSTKRLLKTLLRRGTAMVPGAGCFCVSAEYSDAAATAMVFEKACRVVIESAVLGGGHEISYPESLLMRLIYLMKYSRKAA